MSLLVSISLSVAFAGRSPEPPALDEVLGTLREQAMNSTEAYDELVELCDDIGARPNGSEALDKAILWAQEKMSEDGLDNVHAEPVELKVWKRGELSIDLTNGNAQSLHGISLGGSVGTPKEGIEAEVVVVTDFEELAERASEVNGRFVLFDAPFTEYFETVAYRGKGAIEAAKLGAVGAFVRSVSTTSLDTPHTGAMGYDPEVNKIPGVALTIEHSSMLHRIQDRKGYPKVRLKMTNERDLHAPSANTIGEVTGRSKKNEIVILSCHLDSWDVGQGAQDDGAGCTMVMEAAALIQSLPVKPRRTIQVVLYTGEEYGLSGGFQYRDDHQKGIKKIAAAMEADTGAGQPIGYRIDIRTPQSPDEPDIIAGNKAIQKLEKLRQHLALVGAGNLEAAWSGADISPLVEEGVPGFGLAHEMSGYWPIHHTRADTVEKILPSNLQKNVAATAMLAYYLAEIPDRVNED